ncbi:MULTISPECIES: hypothetical protein [unclassified Nonomuraea]
MAEAVWLIADAAIEPPVTRTTLPLDGSRSGFMDAPVSSRPPQRWAGGW